MDSTKMLLSVLEKEVGGKITDWELSTLNSSVLLKEVSIPTPKSGEVLIRVEKASINPMDLSTIKGTYGTHPDLPAPLGHEGCGVVVKSGGGWFGRRLVGKRVGFICTKKGGAWAEYVVVPATRCMIVENVPWENATACFVNPLTVLAMVELAEKEKQKFIIHTAAASSLGKMLIRYAKKKGIGIIAIVRKEEQKKECEILGAAYSLDSNHPEFLQQLRQILEKVECKIAFDAVAGELTGRILRTMPADSCVFVYGGLSETSPTIHTKDLIFRGKEVKGFWITRYLHSKSKTQLLKWSKIISSYLTSDFSTDIAKTFPLQQINEALMYSINEAHGKKVILHCNSETQIKSGNIRDSKKENDSEKKSTEKEENSSD